MIYQIRHPGRRPRRNAIAIAVLAVSIAAQVSHTAFAADKFPAIGPLPAREAPKASLVEMGKRLFFDVRISGDGAISCATCHSPQQGFARQSDKNGEPMALSDAYPGTRHFRNSPTLLNTAYKADFENVGWGWDGHMGANLNDVMRSEITETMIMNMDMRLMHERMKQDPVYVAWWPLWSHSYQRMRRSTPANSPTRRRAGAKFSRARVIVFNVITVPIFRTANPTTRVWPRTWRSSKTRCVISPTAP